MHAQSMCMHTVPSMHAQSMHNPSSEIMIAEDLEAIASRHSQSGRPTEIEY